MPSRIGIARHAFRRYARRAGGWQRRFGALDCAPLARERVSRPAVRAGDAIVRRTLRSGVSRRRQARSLRRAIREAARARSPPALATCASSTRPPPMAERCSPPPPISLPPWWTGSERRCYDPMVAARHEVGIARLRRGRHARRIPRRLDHRIATHDRSGLPPPRSRRRRQRPPRRPAAHPRRRRSTTPRSRRPRPVPRPSRPIPAPRIELGNLYFDAEQYQEAARWYEAALAIDPSNADVSTDLGVSFYYLNQPDRALAQFDKSLEDQSEALEDAAESGHRAGVRQAGSPGRRQGVAGSDRRGAVEPGGSGGAPRARGDAGRPSGCSRRRHVASAGSGIELSSPWAGSFASSCSCCSSRSSCDRRIVSCTA